jgi:hypothetical protein
MATQENPPTKSEFIRQQPEDTSAEEVVEKAKAEGLTIDVGFVRQVRSRAKAKRRSTKSSVRGTPLVRAETKAKSSRTKAEFVRARSHLSPKEIVEDAKSEGVELDVAYVYKLRTAGRKTTAAHRGPSTDSGTSSGTPLVVATTNAERLLIAIAAEVGLGRAISVLEGERARVRALING